MPGARPWLGAALAVLSALLSALPNVFYEGVLKENSYVDVCFSKRLGPFSHVVGLLLLSSLNMLNNMLTGPEGFSRKTRFWN